MDSILLSLNNGLQFDKDAQHILENSRNIAHTTANAIALSSTPTITSLNTIGSQHTVTTTSDFFRNLGASFINSIQLQNSHLNSPAAPTVDTITADNLKVMDFSLPAPNIIIDTNNYDAAMDDLQKQVEYDKFMNEVWIGIVLTLILISMVFCFCSCFLYHQFRVWKRNYRTTLTQNNDTDNVKISMDFEDPVPEYTLVSGLPSYESALELLHKNPQSCLIVHPSVFEVFNRNEKVTQENTAITINWNSEAQEAQAPLEVLTPLLNESPTTPKTPQVFIAALPSYQEATVGAVSLSAMPYNHSFTSLSMVNEKSQSKSTPINVEKSLNSPTLEKMEKS